MQGTVQAGEHGGRARREALAYLCVAKLAA